MSSPEFVKVFETNGIFNTMSGGSKHLAFWRIVFSGVEEIEQLLRDTQYRAHSTRNTVFAEVLKPESWAFHQINNDILDKWNMAARLGVSRYSLCRSFWDEEEVWFIGHLAHISGRLLFRIILICKHKNGRIPSWLSQWVCDPPSVPFTLAACLT